MTHKLLLAAALSFIFAFPTNAQDQKPGPTHEQMMEKMKARKIAYLTKELELTPVEAQQFWPVYNEYEAKKEAILKKRRDLLGKSEDLEALSDAEASKKLDQILILEQKELDLQKEYVSKFRAVLSGKKVAKLYKAEHMFKMRMVQEFRKRKSPGHPKGQGSGTPQNAR